MDATPALSTPPRLALGGAFRIERELGTGASRVFVARERSGGRRLVVKAVADGADDAARARFRREIALTRRVRHPNVVLVLGAGHVDGVDYFTMPYVDGESLRERLARDGPLPVDEALRIAHALADALHHAHRRGVVHRDVKPENVLLADGRPVLIDFGIACPIAGGADRRITAVGLLVGTPTYMSPEQALGEGAVDGRTDVYALGCVLYEMLTGEPPFSGRSDVVLCRRLCEPAPHPRVRRAELSAEADAVVVRALAPRPGDRYQSAVALAAALDHASRQPLRSAAWHTRGWRSLLATGWTMLG